MNKLSKTDRIINRILEVDNFQNMACCCEDFSEFVPSMRVNQKNWTWFLSDDLDGSVVPFISGMTV